MQNTLLALFILSSLISCQSSQTRTTAGSDLATPTLGEEYSPIPEDEKELTAQVSKIFQGIVNMGYQKRKDTNDNRPARRDAHAKHHGCVAANFTIESNVPPEAKVGLFAEPTTYKAIIRFSNGSFEIKDDKLGDAHGMAIKLLGVNGPKLLNSEESFGENDTHDFVMIDNPVFFMRRPQTYLPFFEAQFKGPEAVKEWAQNNPYEFALMQKTISKHPSSPLSNQYWSQTPYKLGARAMKFTAKPCDPSKNFDLPEKKRGETYLKDVLAKQLKSKSACYDFFVVLQTDAEKTPVEDPTIEWPEDSNTLIKVASLFIPPHQATATQEAMEMCEDLSFTPWHASPEMRPLGGVNRVRKDVYIETSKLRHKLNEPKGATLRAANEQDWKKLFITRKPKSLRRKRK